MKDNDPRNSSFYTEEMEETTSNYVSYILELLKEVKGTCRDPIVMVEQQVDISKYVPESFGTVDACIVGSGILHIVDFKYGKGVPVSAIENPQMKLYALGCLEMFDCLYEIDQIEMHIFQPRLSNLSSFSMKKEELIKGAEEILIPTAKLAYEGKGEFNAGDHCRFCKSRATCRARAEKNLKLADYDNQKPPLLTDDEIEEVLEKVDDLTAWANAIKDYALHEAMNGKKWKNWKLVEGRSNRKFSDDQAVAEAVIAAGLDPYEKKLLSITELQKRIGKTTFAEVVERFVIKPAGKPTLVPRSDRREEINSAASDFADLDN